MPTLIIDNENDLLARAKEALAQLPLNAQGLDRVATKLARIHSFLILKEGSLRSDSTTFNYTKKFVG
jgi:hypothetical protein